MPDPYDYTSTFANVPAPGDAIMAGVKNGIGLADVQTQRAQQARDLAAQQQKKQVILDLVNNPNASADDYAKATVLVPELHAQFKQAWDTKNTAQQQSELRRITDWSAAIQTGNPKIASDGMRAQADAVENTAGGPTPESKALRAKADSVDANPQAANVVIKSMLMAHPDGKRIVEGIVALGGEQRAQDLAPAAVRKANADADTSEADVTTKNLGIVAQTLGSLQGKNAKPTQAYTAIQSLVARKVLSPEDGQALRESVPTSDAKALDAWFGQQRDAGISAKEQKAYTTPDANAQLSAQTSKYSTDSAARTAGARLAFDKEQAAAGDDVASLTGGALDNAAARYNIDGTLPPMGMGAAASAGRTKILNRAAELKAGVDPEQQRRDQLNNKADIANKNKAISAFTSGKQGNAIRSFNVLLTHLDTLDSLSDALDNGNVQAVNSLGNAFAKATGKAAPTNFEGVKHIVGDELVKAVTGGAGALGDRESIAEKINSANSPNQLKGMIHNYKELAVGQLTGLEGQYKVSTGLNDFEHLLSPAARLMRNQHGGGAGAAGATAGGGKVVDFGSLK